MHTVLHLVHHLARSLSKSIECARKCPTFPSLLPLTSLEQTNHPSNKPAKYVPALTANVTCLFVSCFMKPSRSVQTLVFEPTTKQNIIHMFIY